MLFRSDIQAKSYNFEDGQLKIVTIGESECHIEKINENWSRKKFAIPNVRAGTVIDYTYTINSDYMLNLPDWEFQWQIPVLNSRYTIGMIPFYEYQFLLQGANEFDEYNSIKSTGLEREFFGVKFTDMIYTFGMKNLPSFKDESYITSASDYIIKLDFQLSKINYPNGGQVDVLTTWPLLIKDMMVDPDFGKFAIAARKQAKNLIPVSRLILLPEQQRLDSVVNFVKTNFQWNESYGLHVRQKMKEILTKRRASSSEINLLTVGLLNAVGIKADPVILSTRNNGKVKRSYPFLNSFNNTIAVATVDSNQVLIDATDLLLPNNRIPTSCLNEIGRAHV